MGPGFLQDNLQGRSTVTGTIGLKGVTPVPESRGSQTFAKKTFNVRLLSSMNEERTIYSLVYLFNYVLFIYCNKLNEDRMIFM